MFPGRDALNKNMARELYRTEPAFREQVDIFSKRLEYELSFDLRRLMDPAGDYPSSPSPGEADQTLDRPEIAAAPTKSRVSTL